MPSLPWQRTTELFCCTTNREKEETSLLRSQLIQRLDTVAVMTRIFVVELQWCFWKKFLAFTVWTFLSISVSISQTTKTLFCLEPVFCLSRAPIPCCSMASEVTWSKELRSHQTQRKSPLDRQTTSSLCTRLVKNGEFQGRCCVASTTTHWRSVVVWQCVHCN